MGFSLGSALGPLTPLLPLAGAAAGASFGGPMGGMIGANVGSGIAGMAGQEQANQQNMDIAQRQMTFQADMSSTAYQRAMEDMRRAGLNPILAANNGGASTPSGASATMQNAAAPLVQGIGNAVNSAMDYTKFKNDQKATESAIGLNQAKQDTEATTQALNVAGAKAAIARAQSDTSSAKQANLVSQKIQAELPMIIKQAKVGEKQADFDDKALEWDNYSKRANSLLGTAATAKDLFNVGNLLVPNKKSSMPGTGVLKDGTHFDLETGEIMNRKP